MLSKKSVSFGSHEYAFPLQRLAVEDGDLVARQL